MNASPSKQVLYKETQFFYLIIATTLAIIALCLITYFGGYSKKTTPLAVIISPILILTIVTVLFYKMEITITNDYLENSFGNKLIKRKILLSEIDVNKLQKVKFPWYYGIGLRLTPQGTLYNTKVGPAIKIVSKDGQRTILIGTDNFEKIAEVLKEKLS